MKKWKVQLEIEVAESWVAEGFNLREEDLQDAIRSMLPYAYGHEVATKISFLSSPTKKEISDLQDGTVEAID